MKKIILILLIAGLCSKAYSQTCEEREQKLLVVMGGFSAGYLYNTYGMIGSIADGFGHAVYETETVADLIKAQEKLAENIITLLEKSVTENVFASETDKNYINSSVTILKGLKKQMSLLIVYSNNKSKKNLDALEAQRNQNWKDLSKLMGVKE